MLCTRPGGGGGGEGTPCNDLYGEARPARGNFFRLQVNERVVISLVELYERVRKSVISVCKKAKGTNRCFFLAAKKSRKRSGFVIWVYFKDSVLQ